MMMEGKTTVTYQTNAVFSPNNAVGMADGNAGSSSQDDERGSAAAGFRRAETLLRLFPMALCVVALVLMLKNSQSNTDFGSISYSDVVPFKYLVHANGICAGYSLLSAVVAAIPRPFSMPRAWTFFLLDQLLTYVVLAAGAVATEVVYLNYKGDSATTWSESCVAFGGFCHKATTSVVITFAVSLSYVAISLISSYRLFSKYDAPVVLHNGKGIEIPAF